MNNSMLCSKNSDHSRVIIHIDIDCFYAQVEMVKNPVLKGKPVGVQQKNLMVTCNYVARSMGVKKSMWIDDAKKILPKIILVDGSDLTYYRHYSAEIFSVLQTYTRMVERLGMDENFIDVSEILDDYPYNNDIVGRVFNLKEDENANSNETCLCGCYERLVKGTHIAKVMRDHIYESTGITTCAGIAHNKILAKLVSSHQKPNNQTLAFPHQVHDIMKSLTCARDIPGIGHVTFKTLESLGIKSVEDLQSCTLNLLNKKFDADYSCRLKNLSLGIDYSIVKSSGPPQTLSLEDAFKKVSTEIDVKSKLRKLTERLLKLLVDDGRFPSSLRVTVRKFKKEIKFGQRESKNVPLPPSLFGLSGKIMENEKTVNALFEIALKTFKTMVNISQAFHLTLLGVGFTKLYKRAQNSQSICHFLSNSENRNKVLKSIEGALNTSTNIAEQSSKNNSTLDLKNLKSKQPTLSNNNLNNEVTSSKVLQHETKCDLEFNSNDFEILSNSNESDYEFEESSLELKNSNSVHNAITEESSSLYLKSKYSTKVNENAVSNFSSQCGPPSPSFNVEIWNSLPEDIKREISKSPNLNSRKNSVPTTSTNKAFSSSSSCSKSKDSIRNKSKKQKKIDSYFIKTKTEIQNSSSNINCPENSNFKINLDSIESNFGNITNKNENRAILDTESSDNITLKLIKKGIDLDIFEQLPSHIKKEILSEI